MGDDSLQISKDMLGLDALDGLISGKTSQAQAEIVCFFSFCFKCFKDFFENDLKSIKRIK